MKPRPEQAGPGEESVWDYPRPPRVEPVAELIRIVFDGHSFVESRNAFRVLETSHPPSYYIPQSDIDMSFMEPTSNRSFCEFKGRASYWTVRSARRAAENSAWGYLNPSPGFELIQGCVSFYASKMDACFVGDEQVQAQAGDFYGGWITSKIRGPFKGGPGSWGW